MKGWLRSVVVLLTVGMLLQTQGYAQNAGGQFTVVDKYDVDSTTFTYCSTGPTRVGPGSISTSGASTTVTGDATAKLDTNLNVGDLIYATNSSTGLLTRYVASVTSETSITIEARGGTDTWTLGAGTQWRFANVTCGTGASSGWVNVSQFLNHPDGQATITAQVDQLVGNSTAVLGDGVNTTGGMITVTHAAALNAYPITISVWVKTSTISGVKGLINKYAAGSFNGYLMFFSNTDLCSWYLLAPGTPITGVYDAATCPLKVSGINDGTWHHVVFVVDAAGGRVYDNAALKNSYPWLGTPGPVTGVTDLIFDYYSSATQFLAAALDEIRIYNVALTPAQISALYTSTTLATTDLGLSANLVGYWKMDEGSGTSAADSSGNGRTGTLAGGMTWTTGIPSTGVGLRWEGKMAGSNAAPVQLCPTVGEVTNVLDTAAGINGRYSCVVNAPYDQVRVGVRMNSADDLVDTTTLREQVSIYVSGR